LALLHFPTFQPVPQKFSHPFIPTAKIPRRFRQQKAPPGNDDSPSSRSDNSVESVREQNKAYNLSHSAYHPPFSIQQSTSTYWCCDEFEDDLPSSSKKPSYLQKYSSASTVDLAEDVHELERQRFEKLVEKYNLYAYIQTDIRSVPQHLPNQHLNDAMDQPNTSLETVKGICKIPARLTGFFGLITQVVVILIALALTISMFYQLGGCKYFKAMRNETEPITAPDNGTFPTPMMLELQSMLSNNTVEVI
jgi:hypothetical protein